MRLSRLASAMPVASTPQFTRPKSHQRKNLGPALDRGRGQENSPTHLGVWDSCIHRLHSSLILHRSHSNSSHLRPYPMVSCSPSIKIATAYGALVKCLLDDKNACFQFSLTPNSRKTPERADFRSSHIDDCPPLPPHH